VRVSQTDEAVAATHPPLPATRPPVLPAEADGGETAVATGPGAEPTAADVGLGPAVDRGPARFLNRELSWLDFNARVLALAEDPAVPLLERVKFLAIFSDNLDEFYQVRVGGLVEQVHQGVAAVTPDGLTARQQLDRIREVVARLVIRHAELFGGEIRPALSDVGISFPSWDSLAESDRVPLTELFERYIFPVLTPLAVDPAHPFPYISDLSLNLAVMIEEPPGDDGDDDDTGPSVPHFARVKVPPSLPRFVALPDGGRFVPLEQVIAAHLDRLFPGMQILEHHPFRVTRNAGIEVEEDEAEDLLEAMETVLRRRRRFGRAVRLEVQDEMDPQVLELLLEELQLERDDVHRLPGPLGLSGLWAVWNLGRPELKDAPWEPLTTPELAHVESPAELFGVVRRRDILVHHPYESFTTSVEAFIEAAADDPDVLAIKQTLYRTSLPESPIVTALIEAAEAGKQVVALVELKARFDELANIQWARALEQAGVHVVYGVVGLKTHAKLSLVVRQEEGGLRRYTHVGTGNYNPRTATIYEDVGIFSADDDLGADVTDLFNFLTGYSRQRRYRKLLVAPLTLRNAIIDMIDEEAGRSDGRIVGKMNSLVDPAVIDALYAASASGTEIDLIVRGICCLRPGVAGLSENIRVRSIVGRFLEHSRIYAFGPERGFGRPRRYFIGSADLMPRNLDRRVEAVVPVTDPKLEARLEEILATNLEDDTLAWELGPDDRWRRARTQHGLNTHRVLMESARNRARAAAAASLTPVRTGER
jgi:polyphosphate kinase